MYVELCRREYSERLLRVSTADASDVLLLPPQDLPHHSPQDAHPALPLPGAARARGVHGRKYTSSVFSAFSIRLMVRYSRTCTYIHVCAAVRRCVGTGAVRHAGVDVCCGCRCCAPCWSSCVLWLYVLCAMLELMCAVAAGAVRHAGVHVCCGCRCCAPCWSSRSSRAAT